MSMRCMSRVWEESRAKGSSLLLLLAIADYAKDDGTDAFPSLETLAAKTRMSARQVWRLIGDLEHLGELRVKRSPGRRAHRYSVIRPRQDVHVEPGQPGSVEPGQDVKVEPGHRGQPTLTPKASNVDIAMSTEPPGTVKNHHHQSGGGGLEAIEEALRVLTLREFDQELSKGRIVENPKAYRAEIKRRLRRELAAVLRVSLTKDLTADQILAEVDREYVARASEALAREVEELRKRMLDKLAQRKHFHPDREALIDEILRLIPELRLHASLVDELRGAA